MSDGQEDATETEIFVTYNGEQITIKVEIDDTIGTIKNELEKKTGLAVKNQKLVYNTLNKEFDDTQTLRYYGLRGSGAFFELSTK